MGDVPTWSLLVGAGFTAWYARRAFGKQSEELTALTTEVADGQTLIRQQSELIGIQSGQLEEQRKLAAKQIEVLELQRGDLEASVAERKREADERESAQAAMVATWFGSRQIDVTFYSSSGPAVPRPGATAWGAFLRNASHLPVF